MAIRRMLGAWTWYQQQLVKRPIRTQVVTSTILWAAGDAVAQKVDRTMSERRRHQQLQGGRDRGQRPQKSYEGNEETQKKGAFTLPQGKLEEVLLFHHQQHMEKHPRLQGGAFAEPAHEALAELSPPNHTMDLQRISTTGLFGAAFVGPIGHYWYAGLEHFVKFNLRLRPKSTPFLVSKIALDTFIFGPVHLVAFFTWTGLVSGHPLKQIKKDVARDFVPAFLTEATVWPIIQFANFRFVPVQHQLLFVNFFCLIDSAWLSWLKYEQDAPWKRALLNLMPWASEH